MICLVYPPSVLPPSLTLGTVPLGIYKVATMLKESGFAVSLLDQYSFLEYAQQAEKISEESFLGHAAFRKAVEEADVLGFSVDSYNYGSGRLMARAAKKINPEIRIVMGGPHSTLLDEHVARTSGADVVLRGEAEGRLIPLMTSLQTRGTFDSIPGVTYKTEEGEVVRRPDAPLCSSEMLAAASHIDYAMITRLDEVRLLPVETSRGCLFSCRFCSILYKGKRRLLPLEGVRGDLTHASELKNEILITDDCLTLEFARAKEILDFFNSLGPAVGIHFETRASDLAKEACPVLTSIDKERVRFIQMGVECGYEEGLRTIRKGITLAQVEKACQEVCRHGVERAALLSFIIGFPWESTSECLKTIAFADQMRRQYGVNTVINFWVPSPSELWLEMKQRGVIDDSMYDDPNWCYSNDVFTRTHPRISIKEKHKLQFLADDAMSLSA